ncbi:MAG: LssY C-terminal domain-containing protein, partial [Victivallales bacterium]
NFFRIALAVAVGRSYDSAPVTPVFWLNDTNDFTFEKYTEDTIPRRHCVRFWKTRLVDVDGNALYVGASGNTEGWGSLDIAGERSMLLEDLNGTGLLSYFSVEKLREPGASHKTFRVRYFTDGMTAVIILK